MNYPNYPMHLQRNPMIQFMVSNLPVDKVPVPTQFPSFMGRAVDTAPFKVKTIDKGAAVDFMGQTLSMAYFTNVVLRNVSDWPDRESAALVGVAVHRAGLPMPERLRNRASELLAKHSEAEAARETEYHQSVSEAIASHPATKLAQLMAKKNRLAAAAAQAESMGMTLAPHLMAELRDMPVVQTNKGNRQINW